MNIKQWLQGNLECKSSDINMLYSSKTGLDFLLVWNIFEVKLFDKYCTKDKLHNVAIRVSESVRCGELQKFIEHFHYRYHTDKVKYRNLKHGSSPILIPDEVVKNRLQCSTVQDKLHFLLFVLFRYRNNMFHGNKGLINWLQYDEQIRLCTEAMCIFVDIHEELDH